MARRDRARLASASVSAAAGTTSLGGAARRGAAYARQRRAMLRHRSIAVYCRGQSKNDPNALIHRRSCHRANAEHRLFSSSIIRLLLLLLPLRLIRLRVKRHEIWDLHHSTCCRESV